jgi:uncharacterized cupredoxin-like copper-binding protein
MKHLLSMVVAASMLAVGAAHAHNDTAHADETAFGHPGDPAKARRTIEVRMTDAMRFAPAAIAVGKGETVSFIVRNDGNLVHEMVLGAGKDLHEHAAMMRELPQVGHAEPNAVRVEPGTKARMVWTFDKAGRFTFACLVPGHFEAGMKGRVEVD